MNKEKIPQTDSIAELAEFWDTHDLTDFEDELEEVEEPVFVKSRDVTIHLRPDEAAAIRTLAEQTGEPEADLIQRWIREKLQLVG